VRAGERKARMSTEGAMRDEDGGEGVGRGLVLLWMIMVAVVVVFLVLLSLRADVFKDIDR
jgi:hypothetical protein